MHALLDRGGEAMVIEAGTVAMWEVQHQDGLVKVWAAEPPCRWAEAARQPGGLVLEDEVSPSVLHSTTMLLIFTSTRLPQQFFQNSNVEPERFGWWRSYSSLCFRW